MSEENPLRLLRLPTVIERTGLSRSMIYRLVSAGQFPRPVRITARASGFVESEVTDYIRQKIAASAAR
jgi:prophage regulatory protein